MKAKRARRAARKPATRRRKRTPLKLVVDNQPARAAEIEISDGAMTRARARRRRPMSGLPAPLRGRDPFEPYKPLKGVVPEGQEATMAMDSGLSGAIAAWVEEVLPDDTPWAEGLVFFGYQYLAQLAQRPEYRKISERLATEMTRKWIKVQSRGNADKTSTIKVINDELERLHVREAFGENALQDGLMGRSHLYLDTGDTDDPAEMKVSIGSGSDKMSEGKVTPQKPLLAVRPVEATWCYPADYESRNPLKAGWYKPESWWVMGKQVHASRLLTFIGRDVPDVLKPAYAFGGLPLTQMLYPYVNNWLGTRESVARLTRNFSKNGIKTNLQTVLSGQSDGQSVMTRADFYNALSDNRGLMMLDKDSEEFFQVNTPLSTLDALQAQALEQLGFVPSMPLVILLGSTPKGLNASSDGEMRAWSEWTNAYQQHLWGRQLKAVIDFIQLSKFGKVDPDIVYVFEPLMSLSAKEVAEMNKIKSETDTTYVDGGVLSTQEVRARVATDPDSGFSSIDVDDLPPEPADEGADGGDSGAPSEEDAGDRTDGGSKPAAE